MEAGRVGQLEWKTDESEKMRKAAVTGGTGFLGFALLNELVESGIETVVLCRPKSRRIDRFAGFHDLDVRQVDLNDIAAITNSISDVEVFYHLAWGGGRNNFDEQYHNVGIALNCLKAAADVGCRHFVCVGSQAEYGETTEMITEETPLRPVTAYGACKTAAYYLTADLAARVGLQYIWARAFSVYGPNDNQHTLIMSLLRNVMQTGTTVLDTNGLHIWNYIFERDVARALRLLGESDRADGVYNVAGRRSVPLRRFVEEICEIIGFIGYNTKIVYGDDQCSVNLDVSTEKLSSLVGEFEFTEFCDGISEIIRSIERI